MSCRDLIDPDAPLPFSAPDPFCGAVAEAEWVLLIGKTNEQACECYDEQSDSFGGACIVELIMPLITDAIAIRDQYNACVAEE